MFPAKVRHTKDCKILSSEILKCGENNFVELMKYWGSLSMAIGGDNEGDISHTLQPSLDATALKDAVLNHPVKSPLYIKFPSTPRTL